jgi:hypothetical protein
MNYCAPRNRNSLSAGDREGSELMYGTSPAGVWVRTLPSQLQFLDTTYTTNLPGVFR